MFFVSSNRNSPVFGDKGFNSTRFRKKIEESLALCFCPPWGRAGGGVGGVRQVRIDRTSSRVKLLCDCEGDGGDDNDVNYDRW